MLCGLLVVEGYFVIRHSKHTYTRHTGTCSLVEYGCLLVLLRWVIC